MQQNTKVYVNFSDATGVEPLNYDVTEVVEFDQGDGSPHAVAVYAAGGKVEIILPDELCREIVRTWAMIDLKVTKEVN